MCKYLLLLQDNSRPGLLNAPFFTRFWAFSVAAVTSASLTELAWEEEKLVC